MSIDIEKSLTPYKYKKPVLEGTGIPNSYNALAVDCPFVFWHNGKYYMMHVGFDGKGYQTALSVSDNLLEWSEGTVIFPRDNLQGWDKVGVAGVWILKENNFADKPKLKKVNGKYWMVYHSYPQVGYEEGSAEIGLAYTEDETLLHWERLPKPILSWKDGEEWERGGLYKGCLIEEDGKYYLFYNAKQKDEFPWNEQIGMAVSDDMIHWRRNSANPVIRNSEKKWDSLFCSDPYVVKDHEKWVMFYFGYDGHRASDGIAFSENLFDWKKHEKPILMHGKKGEIDSFYAHKPSVLKQGETMYHFYCAVRESDVEDRAKNMSTVAGENTEYRCITVASNKKI